jgi:hypothetical protein
VSAVLAASSVSTPPCLEPLRVPAGEFYALVHLPAGPARGAVVFAHGLGECRSGTNYLLRELGDERVAASLATIRFDLAALGDSVLPLEPGLWREQLAAACDLAAAYVDGPLHLLGRGSGCCALRDLDVDGMVVALRPPLAHDLAVGVSLEPDADGRLRPAATDEPDEVRFWESLGVEVPLIGGLEVPHALIAALEPWRPVPGSATIFPAFELGDAPPGTLGVEGADRLFMHKRDRVALRALVRRLLS